MPSSHELPSSHEHDTSVLWRPPISGVEVLHAHFRRHEYPRHIHDAATVALMDSGAASFHYRGQKFVAAAGSVFMLNAGAVHTGRLASPDGYRYRVLYLDPHALEPLMDAEADRGRLLSFRETVVHDPTLADLLDRTHRALILDGCQMLQEELLLSVGELLFSRYVDSRAIAATAAANHDRAVSTAQDYLESRPAEKISLRELALVTASSPYRLARMFSAVVGMPPHAYQNQVRIHMARRLLATGTPIACVATQVGFCDQAHLTRVFKKYTGVTPYQFLVGARQGAATSSN
jgi:AraC-like DNA-binding protein